MEQSPAVNRWRIRIFSAVWVTYFAYYLCRYNMPMAKTRLSAEFGWGTAQIGLVFTAFTLLYALGQFANGQLADRFGARLVASLGVLGSVAMNLVVFALTLPWWSAARPSAEVLVLLALFWGCNGFFQSMGWAPMVRIMAHWFPARGRGRVMGLLGTCYQFGGAFAWLLAFFLTGTWVSELGGDWRAVFWVPAALFALVGVFFFLAIRNAPEDVGLPPVDGGEGCAAPAGRRSLRGNIRATLCNPQLWIVAGTFFLLDVNRYGFVNWLPAFLDERGGAAAVAGFDFQEVMKRCIHPLSGAAGAILAGWATDRFFDGRRAPVIAVLLVLLGGSSILFPFIDPERTWLVILVVALVGLCTYGPHILLVGHAAQDFGKKSGAAGAAGFIDCMGYLGASLAGWGAGRLIETWDYESTFVLFGVAALAGAALICSLWKVSPQAPEASR